MAATGEHRISTSRHLRAVFGAGAIGSLPDHQLLERFLAGRGDDDSASAFAALVERHGPMVLSVCRNALGHLQDAEDAAQATFLVLAKRAGSIRRADSLASWLFGVAIKMASKARTRSAHRRAVEQKGAEMRALAADSAMSPETRSELYEALGRLPERLRAPIVLCHLEGLTNEQAASQLRLPVRTVQRRLAQGRDRLRHRLARLGLAPASGAPAFPIAEAVPESWIEATVQAAVGLAAGRGVGAVASAPVAALANGAIDLLTVGRLRTIAPGLAIAGTVALAAFGALIAARPQGRPPAAGGDAARSASPPVARVGPWIRGIVVDEQGQPVAGAQVRSLWTIEAKPVTTRSDGTFALPTDEPRLSNQSIIATADGGARQGIFRFDGPSGPKGPRTLARVVLRPTQGVTITVVDGRGAPVPDASVFVLDLVFPVAQGRTDAGGIAALRAPADAWTQWIVAAKPGVGFDYFENYRSTMALPFSPPPTSARLVLDGALSVRVRALDSASRPVPGVELYPLTIQKKGKLRAINLAPLPIDARTGANGVATFGWLPADIQQGTVFLPVSRSHSLAGWTLLDPEKPGAELASLVLRLTRVSGKVTRPDGSPAPGIRVEAAGVGGHRMATGSGRALTAADGSYAMELPPEQSYMIVVIDDEWAAPSLSGIVVREDVPRTGLDLTLERGCVIRGRVTTGRESRPAPGQLVTLTESGPAVPNGTFKHQPPEALFNAFMRVWDTDEDGRYAFRVGPGTYQLAGPSVPGEPSAPIEVKVVSGQEIERDFHLPRDISPWKTLRGVVRAGATDGPPIADAVLVLEPIEVRRPPDRGYADDRGRFVLPRLTGKVILYARSPAGDFAGYAVIDGDDERERTLLARPATTARGRVVDEDGRPWASADVAYVVDVGLPAVDRDGPPGAVQSVLTDADGRFAAPGLPIGSSCHFRVSGPAGRDATVHRIEVKDGRPIDLPPLVIHRGTPKHAPR